MKKRFFALLLALCLVVSLLPAQMVIAEGTDGTVPDSTTETTTETTVSGSEETTTETTLAPAGSEETTTETTLAPAGSEETTTETTAAPSGNGEEVVPETTVAPTTDPAQVPVTISEVEVAQVGDNKYETLQAAVAAAKPGDTITLLTDTKLSTMVTIPNGANVTLDLNGHTITGTDTTEKNFSLLDNRGTLKITSSAAGGKMTLTAKIDSDWNRYSAVVANNPGGNLTIENNVALEHLGGTDMAYGIDNLTNGKGTYAVTTVNGGTIKSTYRGIRQFLNGIEATNTLTINGGTVEGANKAIFFHDPSNKANTGKLTIGKNARINGGVYLYVTEGSTEWPVEVSVAAEALDEKGVTYKNVPNGHAVANINGTYGVYTGVAVVDGTQYDTLQKAVAAADPGDTITLLQDVSTSEIVALTKSVTLDGNNHTLTSSANRAINVDCKDAVEIKNLTIKTTLDASKDIRAVNVIQKAAKLTLTNVSADGFKYTINVAASSAGSEIAISGGTYSGYAALNITGNKTTVNAENVAFIGVNPYGNPSSNSFCTISFGSPADGVIADGVSITITGGSITAKATGEAGQCCFGYAKNGATNLSANLNTTWILNGENTGYIAVPDGVTAKYITGGTFNEDVSEYCAEGYKCVKVEENTYDVHKHKLVFEKGHPATCKVTGVKDCYVCETCMLKYSDAEGKNEITDVMIPVDSDAHTLKHVPADPYTCTEPGMKEHYACVDCEKTFTDAEGTQPIDKVYLVEDACHNLTHYSAQKASCTVDGHIDHFKCDKCQKLFADQQGTKELTAEEVIIKAAHKPTKVEAKDATYTAPGVKSHYACQVCAEKFLDERCETKVTDAELVIAQLIEVVGEKAEVSSGAVDKAIEEAAASGDKKDVVLDLTREDVVGEVVTPVTKTEIPAAAIEKVADADASLTLTKEDATVTMDTKALDVVSKAAKEEGATKIALVVEEIKTEELNAKQQEAVKEVAQEKKVAKIISAELLVQTAEGEKKIGTEAAGGFGGGTVTVKIPFTPETGYKGSDYSVVYVADDGTTKEIKTEYEGGYLVVALEHFSDYVIVNNADKGDDNSGTGEGESQPTTPEETKPQETKPQETKPQETKPAAKPGNAAPNTGDNANIIGLFTVLMVSGLLAVAFLVLRKKQRA